jgi:hypothetical protein
MYKLGQLFETRCRSHIGDADTIDAVGMGFAFGFKHRGCSTTNVVCTGEVRQEQSV